MYKRICAAALLYSAAAMAQEVDLNGKDFLSGAGDAKLADIARQAAAEGKVLEVTAPDYWQSKVAGKLHAGAANVGIKANNGFFENVSVRAIAGKAEPKPADAAAKAAAAERSAADRAAAERAAAERAAADRAESDRIAAEQAAAAKAAADRAAADKAAAEKAAADKAVADKAAAEKAAADKAAAEKAAATKAAADKIAAIRSRMEKNVNDGREADGALNVSQLQKDDQLFIDENIRGVVRRSGAHTQMFWLEGDLNLDRVELVPIADGHYKIAEAIRDLANPVLRTRSAGGSISVKIPAANASERKSLQQQFADGHDVTESLHPADLRAGDIIYTGMTAGLVVRHSGTGFLRYWLDGDLNLGQAGLQKQSANAYRVLSDTIR